MKFHKQVRTLAADTQNWRRIRLNVEVPRDREAVPMISLMLLHQRGRVPEVNWVETWDAEAPLPDVMDLERVYEWLLGCLWDRLDQEG